LERFAKSNPYRPVHPSRTGQTTEAEVTETNRHGRKLLYRVQEAAELTSLSRTKLYERIAAGDIESVKCGGTRLIPHDALEDFVARLRSEGVTDAVA
jgi:excisionase family DNA binding protein